MMLQRFWRIDDSGLKSPQELYGQIIYAIRTAVSRWLFETRPASNMLCEDKGMPSRATRGYMS